LIYRRALLSATIALSLAVSALAAAPVPAALAAPSCTGWTSITTPPETIRVGRADGSVAIVPFRQYVGVVMMREWSPSHPAATLEAGAVAAKQYGWYYALAGHWRRSYINEAGQCYDVKGTTADQLYAPERVGEVDPRMWRAIDATWGLSVRKSDRFFLTGYRTGEPVPCASDANGYRLFAKSAINCGRNGWTREQIQLAYYAPDVTFHWSEDVAEVAPLDTPITPPDVVDLVAGTTTAGEYVRVRWDRQEARPAGTFYELQRAVDGAWVDVPLDDPEARSVTAWLRPNVAHRYRVRLADAGGGVGPWHTGTRFTPRLVESTATAFSWSSGWKKGYANPASGGSFGYASRAGATVTFSFSGSEVALVGTLGPTRGQARIWLDGVLQDGVHDMYAATTTWRAVWFRHQFADAGPHTVTVEVVGTSGRPRVDVDAALVLP
jgi:hypothetical protein